MYYKLGVISGVILNIITVMFLVWLAGAITLSFINWDWNSYLLTPPDKWNYEARALYLVSVVAAFFRKKIFT